MDGDDLFFTLFLQTGGGFFVNFLFFVIYRVSFRHFPIFFFFFLTFFSSTKFETNYRCLFDYCHHCSLRKKSFSTNLSQPQKPLIHVKTKRSRLHRIERSCSDTCINVNLLFTRVLFTFCRLYTAIFSIFHINLLDKNSKKSTSYRDYLWKYHEKLFVTKKVGIFWCDEFNSGNRSRRWPIWDGGNFSLCGFGHKTTGRPTIQIEHEN